MKRIPLLGLVALPLAGCGADEPIVHPVPLAQDSPFEFPVELWDQGIEGETLVMVHVTEVGEVDSSFVARSSGYAEFDSAAVAGARKLRFSPGRKGERRVGMWARIPVKFAKSGAATAAGTETDP
jgi:TonB family protein